jgi:transcriptional regulator with XRE-family HTH domain
VRVSYKVPLHCDGWKDQKCAGECAFRPTTRGPAKLEKGPVLASEDACQFPPCTPYYVSLFSLNMIETSLGQRLHQLRDKVDLSLSELGKKVGVSPPFLSDIELGRRFPSEEILAKLADALNVPLEELKQYDNRGPIADLKRMMDSDPKLGFAFRTAVEKLKSGELTADDIIVRLAKSPRKK